MGSQTGQATVEHVGMVLAVALLMGGVAAAFAHAGIASMLANRVARAFDLGSSRSDAIAAPALGTDAEWRFARMAVASRLPDAARPTLRDLRLRLIDRLGRTSGEEVFGRMLTDAVDVALPGSIAGSVTSYRDGGDTIAGPVMFDPARAMARIEERALATRTVSPVGAGTGNAFLGDALHTSGGERVLDEAIEGAASLATRRVWIAQPAAEAAIDALVRDDGLSGLSDAGKRTIAQTGRVPPGRREGDLIVMWQVERRRFDGRGHERVPARRDVGEAYPRRYVHAAVLRNGVAVREQLIPVASDPNDNQEDTP
jgi:hypothetical protein